MDESRSSNDSEQRDGTRSIDDPERDKITKDTAQILKHYVRLHHSSSNATGRVSPDSTIEGATPPSRQCFDSTTRGPPSTLPRSKSREATRKDPHPKALNSTRSPSAQIVSSHHCSVDLQQPELKTAGNPISQSNSKQQRPDKLCFQKHKRVPSSHSATGSDSSGKTTPAQDPPMELMSPGAELSSSYPPMSAQIEHREGLMRSAEHARSSAAASASCTTSQERECLCASAIKGGDPRVIKARMIADRLKAIGDEVEDEYNKSKLDDLIMLVMYTQTLSWRKVAELFKRLYRVMETIQYDDQVPLFEKVWGCLLDSVVPWIQDKGGWSALPRETEPRQANTPNFIRRHPPLNPAQSEPVLLHSPTTTPHCCQPLCINGGASTISRIPVGVRTPQMMRHPHPPSREQSSPCLPRERSYSQHSQPESPQGRSRLWSLTSSGRFKREKDGIEDIEQSISELDMTLNDDDDEESEAFGPASQDDEEEGESQQEAEQTLTTSSLQAAIHASASFSNSTSPPIIVPSPHSSSQPETISMEDLHIDSGIDTSSLSLSCSPKVSFILGEINNRPSSSIHGLNQTSLTSLSSVASASPVHMSPSSRKNSSNGTGSGYFSDGKIRPRSGGSLKESRQKHEGDSPPCHRTGSLTSRRPHSRYHRVTTPTNEMPNQSPASGHSSWMETPVRRMSTSAAVIIELIKDIFGGSP